MWDCLTLQPSARTGNNISLDESQTYRAEGRRALIRRAGEVIRRDSKVNCAFLTRYRRFSTPGMKKMPIIFSSCNVYEYDSIAGLSRCANLEERVLIILLKISYNVHSKPLKNWLHLVVSSKSEVIRTVRRARMFLKKYPRKWNTGLKRAQKPHYATWDMKLQLGICHISMSFLLFTAKLRSNW